LALNMHIMKVLCRTLFDCTFTGVTGHFRPQQLPYTTKSGIKIETAEAWNRARNQQRNWESLLQIISLRTQPMNIVHPVKQKDGWHFEFEVEAEGVLSNNIDSDDLAGLVVDCEGVPMVTGLNEQEAVVATLHSSGSNQNIWFTSINKPLEPEHG
jgi:hypothetical protein